MAAGAPTWGEVQTKLAAGDVAGAAAACASYWDAVGGPDARGDGDGSLRELTTRLTVWEQVALFVREVDRRPRNPRSWKLLGYAYLRAGAYVPALLFAAEQAFAASAAYTEDEPGRQNLEEKQELCRRAAAGDGDARAEIASAEASFAAPFETFPGAVPFPAAFVRAGVTTRAALELTAGALAPDLRTLCEG